MEGDATALKAAWSNGSPSRNGGSDLFQPQEPSSSTAGLLSSLPLGHTSGPQGQDSLASAQTLGPRTALDTYGQPTPSNSEANSVARLQQNLQRLYGSYNQLNYGSRTSLPDIQEEDADGSAAASMLRGAGSTARVASEEDLFKLDPIPGTSGAMPAADVPGMGTHHQESRTLLIRGIDPTMADETLKEYFEVRKC